MSEGSVSWTQVNKTTGQDGLDLRIPEAPLGGAGSGGSVSWTQLPKASGQEAMESRIPEAPLGCALRANSQSAAERSLRNPRAQALRGE